MRSSRSAFSLVELLVVVTIVALLAALLFPLAVQAKARAYQTSCASNLGQLGHAFALYRMDHDERLPEHTPGAGIPVAFSSPLAPYAPKSVHVCSTGPYGYLYRLFIVNSDPLFFSLWAKAGITTPAANGYWDPGPGFVLAVCDAHLLEGFTVRNNNLWVAMMPEGRRGKQIVLRADGSTSIVDAKSVGQIVPQVRAGRPVWAPVAPGALPPPFVPALDRFPGEPVPYDLPLVDEAVSLK